MGKQNLTMETKSKSNVIWWLKKGFRLSDNPALTAALARGLMLCRSSSSSPRRPAPKPLLKPPLFTLQLGSKRLRDYENDCVPLAVTSPCCTARSWMFFRSLSNGSILTTSSVTRRLERGERLNAIEPLVRGAMATKLSGKNTDKQGFSAGLMIVTNAQSFGISG